MIIFFFKFKVYFKTFLFFLNVTCTFIKLNNIFSYVHYFFYVNTKYIFINPHHKAGGSNQEYIYPCPLLRINCNNFLWSFISFFSGETTQDEYDRIFEDFFIIIYKSK